MQNIFLDTNIVVDFLGERKHFYIASAKVLKLADKKKLKSILLLLQSLQFIIYFQNMKILKLHWRK